MKELNYDRLRAALDRLPTYLPPSSLWSGIASGMETNATQSNEPNWHLPSYSPPSQVWNTINNQLDKGQQGKRRQLHLLRNWMVQAAAVLLLFSVGYFTSTRDPGPIIEIAETVETRQQPLNVTFASTSNPDDDRRFDDMLLELEMLNRPALNGMRYELEELTIAKQEVEAMLVSYGHDVSIMNQLAEIERERSKVYRQIQAGM